MTSPSTRRLERTGTSLTVIPFCPSRSTIHTPAGVCSKLPWNRETLGSVRRNLQPLADPINDNTRCTGLDIDCDGPLRNSSETSGSGTWLYACASQGCVLGQSHVDASGISGVGITSEPPNHIRPNPKCSGSLPASQTSETLFHHVFPSGSPGRPRKLGPRSLEDRHVAD